MAQHMPLGLCVSLLGNWWSRDVTGMGRTCKWLGHLQHAFAMHLAWSISPSAARSWEPECGWFIKSMGYSSALIDYGFLSHFSPKISWLQSTSLLSLYLHQSSFSCHMFYSFFHQLCLVLSSNLKCLFLRLHNPSFQMSLQTWYISFIELNKYQDRVRQSLSISESQSLVILH